MIKQKKTQLERNEAHKRREANVKFSETLSADGFADDPRADSYDANGRAPSESRSNLRYDGWNMGGFPAND